MRSAKDTPEALSLEASSRRTVPTETSHQTGAAGPLSANARARGPRGILRVPTHAVGRAHERRAYVRARLSLPLRVTRIAGQRNARESSLHTRDISSSGLFFDYPQPLEPGTPVEFEVLLIDRPLGRGSVRMCTLAHVVRAQDAGKPGWHGLAAVFDDIRYVRDDAVAAG